MTFGNEKYLYLNIFLKYLTFSNTFKYVFKDIVSINISVSRSHVMPAKLINFTATSLNSANYTVLLKTFNGRHSHGPGSDHDLCLPEDGLAPDSDHRSIIPFVL